MSEPMEQVGLQPSIKSIQSLLKLSLSIPSYQRPYKWSEKNVQQLLDDIILHRDKSAYRLGTVVIFEDDGKMEIVDGQQRMLTLSLVALALFNSGKDLKQVDLKLKDISLLKWKTNNSITQENLQRNYKAILRQMNQFTDEVVDFFFKKCELVFIKLNSVTEAFQFFDSQNSRGKDLEPHDLLKAFHLREMSGSSEKERLACVKEWEEMDSKQLVLLFDNYLFKVRNWSRGKSARFFTKNDVYVFKGVSIENTDNFNFVQPYRINHFYTETYNNDINRKIDLNKANYPFQIDQVILNGKRFFEYIAYYANWIKLLEAAHKNEGDIDDIRSMIDTKQERAREIVDFLVDYDGNHRVGDKYVRNLFDCCLLYYIDKFGAYDLDVAIEKFFVWAYTVRIERHSVQLATIDNKGIEDGSVFQLIREAIHPKDIRHLKIYPPVSDNKKAKKIVKKFEELNYPVK